MRATVEDVLLMNNLEDWFRSNGKPVLLGMLLGIALTTLVLFAPELRPTKNLSVEPVPVGCRVIRVLADDWYLVEITQIQQAENPLPLGPATFNVKVPHLVRMHKSDLTSRNDTVGLEYETATLQER